MFEEEDFIKPLPRINAGGSKTKTTKIKKEQNRKEQHHNKQNKKQRSFALLEELGFSSDGSESEIDSYIPSWSAPLRSPFKGPRGRGLLFHQQEPPAGYPNPPSSSSSSNNNNYTNLNRKTNSNNNPYDLEPRLSRSLWRSRPDASLLSDESFTNDSPFSFTGTTPSTKNLNNGDLAPRLAAAVNDSGFMEVPKRSSLVQGVDTILFDSIEDISSSNPPPILHQSYSVSEAEFDELALQLQRLEDLETNGRGLALTQRADPDIQVAPLTASQRRPFFIIREHNLLDDAEERSPQSRRSPGMVCSVCFESFINNPDPDYTLDRCFQCQECSASICISCLIGHIKAANSSKLPANCFGVSCRARVFLLNPDFRRILHAEDPEAIKEQLRIRELADNPDMVECPYEDCDELVHCDPRHSNLTCPRCSRSFCQYHSLAHVGEQCPHRNSVKDQITNYFWKKLNTRKCPSCKSSIEKNGGCHHMTCRCSFEICWRCGDPYVKHGRRGHQWKIFPQPKNLKYCCNSWKLWTLRIGCGVVIAPFAIVPLIVLGSMKGSRALGARIRQS